jgi:purine nucleoside permease
MRWLVPLLALAVLIPTGLASAGGSPTVRPRAVVIATFGGPDAHGKFTGEAAPWEANERLTRTITVPGLAVNDENPGGEVHCTASFKLCVTVVGTTKSKSGPGTAALLAYRGWDLSRSKFLLVGIAGIAMRRGTTGDAAIGNIVDTNLGTDYASPQRGTECWLWDPFDVSNGSGNPYTQATYKLPLARWAYELTKDVKLAVGGEDVIAERAAYGAAEAAEVPRVHWGGVGGHDSFWVGKDQSLRQDCIYRFRAKQFGLNDQRYTSAFEDPGVAGALQRRGRLGDFVVVRTGSDPEEERPGTDPKDLYDLLHSPQGFPAFGIAVENEWRVGTVIVHAWGA